MPITLELFFLVYESNEKKWLDSGPFVSEEEALQARAAHPFSADKYKVVRARLNAEYILCREEQNG